MHIYERELTVANGQALTFPAGFVRKLFPIGFPPAGKLLRVMVRQINGQSQPMPAYVARVYDRAWSLSGVPSAYTPTLNGGGTAVIANPSTAFTFATNPGWPTSNIWYGDVTWTIGGLTTSPGQTQPTSVNRWYPGQQFRASGVKFTSTGGNGKTLQITTLGTGDALPLAGQYNAGSLTVSFLPLDAALNGSTAYPPATSNTYTEIIVDENILNPNGQASLTSTGSTVPAYYVSQIGMPYQNREGSFSVPVRKVYLEIDCGANTAPSANCTLEVELACELGNEQN